MKLKTTIISIYLLICYVFQIMNKNNLSYLIIIFGCLMLVSTAHAAILERTIDVHFQEISIKDGLDEVAQKAGFVWSYNAAILPTGKRVTLAGYNLTVRETLIRMMGDDYEFKENGNYLIIKKLKNPQPKLSGYLSDGQTGKKVAKATIYDRQTLKSTTTDDDGFYELPVTPGSEIVIARLGYRDTLLLLTPQTPRFQKLGLHVDTESPEPQAVDWGVELARYSDRITEGLVSNFQKINGLNVRDSLSRRYQVSLLPWIGTNLTMSGQVTNNFSLNILVGYSRGNRVMEVAGLGNITREQANGIQAAGVFNIVGGRCKGWQLAGVANVARGQLRGGQFAGVFNATSNAKNATIQAAGITNIARRGNIAVQLASVNNHCDTLNGFQAAGVFNKARTVQGLQVASVFNAATKVSGVQIAAISNIAQTVHGAQIGLFNAADTISGVQIGLFNRSAYGGYRVWEAHWNDVQPINLLYKSGVPLLYFILAGGVTIDSVNNMWSFGGGIGIRTPTRPRLGASLDLIHRNVNIGTGKWSNLQWAQVAPSIDIRLGRGLYLTGGPTFNLLISDRQNPDFDSNRSRIVPNKPLYENISGTKDLAGWMGWMAGVRWRI